MVVVTTCPRIVETLEIIFKVSKNIKTIREDLIKKPYNVFDCYYETGAIAYIAKHNAFENLTFITVLVTSDEASCSRLDYYS